MAEVRTIHTVTLGEKNKNLDADLWDEKHITDDLIFPGKVSIGENSSNLNNSLNVYDDAAFNNELQAMYSAKDVPEYPDDLSETDYLFTGSDITGWAFTNIIYTTSDESLNLNLNGSTPKITITRYFGSLGVLRLKIKRNNGSNTALKIDLDGTNYLNESNFFSSNNSKIIDIKYTGGVSQIVIDFISDLGSTFDLYFLYTGSGKYSEKFKDIYLHEINGTINGCTPVKGKSAKALRFNSNSDSVVFDKIMRNQNQTITFWANIPENIDIVFAGYKGIDEDDSAFIKLDTSIGTGGLRIALTNTINHVEETFEDFFVIDRFNHFYAFTLSESKLSVYRDGELIDSATGSYSNYGLPVNQIGYFDFS